LYTAQKSNSHYALPQPYTNQSVFKSLLNCTSDISPSRNATDREFQRHGPATEKLLSPRRVRVLVVYRMALIIISSWSSDSCKNWFSGCVSLCLCVYLRQSSKHLAV